MSLEDSEILDLAESTLAQMERLKLQQIAQELVDYEVLPKFMRKDRVTFDGGDAITWRVMVKTSGASKNVGLHEEDVVNIGDVLDNGSIPWRHTTTNYAWERREMLMNIGARRVVSLLKVRRADALLDLTEHMERIFWAKPADSSDKTEPYGVPYWLVKNASVGFNGGDPVGFANGAAGLKTADYQKWKNYTGAYAAVSKADLIKKMRIAHRLTGFKSPVDLKNVNVGRADQYRVYMNNATLSTVEDVGEAQNDNLGRDVASMDGTMIFKKHPMIYAAHLDTDPSDPVYMINFATFRPVVLRGDYLRESKPSKSAKQHNTFVVFVDLTWNIRCVDRRRNAVFHKV